MGVENGVAEPAQPDESAEETLNRWLADALKELNELLPDDQQLFIETVDLKKIRSLKAVYNRTGESSTQLAGLIERVESTLKQLEIARHLT